MPDPAPAPPVSPVPAPDTPPPPPPPPPVPAQAEPALPPVRKSAPVNAGGPAKAIPKRGGEEIGVEGEAVASSLDVGE